MESVGNDIISYSRAKEIVTAYENAMIEENYRNNLAREEGYENGKVEGIEEGIVQGIEQGIEQGSKESKIQIAKSMLSKNFDIEIICECTGLSLEEVKKL